MGISSIDNAAGYRHIKLDGRLDIQGTDEIAQEFKTLCSGDALRVVVDLSEVSFLASIGIRALISNAKALQKSQGRMALMVGNNAMVFKTLETTGIDLLLQLCTDLGQAEQAVLHPTNA